MVLLAKHKNDMLYYFPMENLLKNHIEANFFNLKPSNQSNPSNKCDDKCYNDYFVRDSTEHINYDYSLTSLTTLFNIIEEFENQCLTTLEGERENMVKVKALIPEKRFKKDPQNLIDYFIESHIHNICKELYVSNCQVNNYEVENKLCLSLFLIKKIIKDYSFYLNKVELETIYLGLKKFKK